MNVQCGEYERSINLPGPVQADRMEAKYETDVLTTAVPKADNESRSKSIKVY